MESTDLISHVLSKVHTGGVPYPFRRVTELAEEIDYTALLGDPVVEISVDVENARGQKYNLLITQVIYSGVINSYWFVYGFINETLMTGDPEDIQVLALRWFQGRAYMTPLRLASCRYLECKLLGPKEIAGILPGIPAIKSYQWVN